MIQTYYDRYNELQSKYKICHYLNGQSTDDFDIIISYVGAGYAHKKYKVIKNGPNLSAKDIAIICDRGNLCFGYRVEGSTIIVYTD